MRPGRVAVGTVGVACATGAAIYVGADDGVLAAVATCVVVGWGTLLARLADLSERLRVKSAEADRHEARVRELEAGRQRARAEATDRLSALGTLAGGIAHEINNPLTLVLGNLYLLRDRLAQADPGVRAAVEDARVGAERVRDIVRGLRAYTGLLDTGVLAPLDVRRVMDDAMRLAGEPLHHAATVVRRDEEVPLVLADATRLRQVFLDLLVNAAQAIPAGEPARHEVGVHVRRAGDRVCVEVRDTGVGIPPENRERIFQPFFTTREVGAGTGLGLFAAHGIVAGLGGVLEVDSEPGRGSAFRVLLPAAPEKA